MAYPACFAELKDASYRAELHMDKQRNPEKYSMAATLQRNNLPYQRMKKKQKREEQAAPAAAAVEDMMDVDILNHPERKDNDESEDEEMVEDLRIQQEFIPMVEDENEEREFYSDGDFLDSESESDNEDEEVRNRKRRDPWAQRQKPKAVAVSNGIQFDTDGVFDDDDFNLVRGDGHAHGASSAASAAAAGYFHSTPPRVPLDSRPNFAQEAKEMKYDRE